MTIELTLSVCLSVSVSVSFSLYSSFQNDADSITFIVFFGHKPHMDIFFLFVFLTAQNLSLKICEKPLK